MHDVYLAGPMRGLPEFNFPAFHAAAWRLRKAGLTVVSPAEHDLDTGFDPAGMSGTENIDLDIRAVLTWDLAQVLQSMMVVLLPGWQKSKGALAEKATAEAAGIPTVEYVALVL